MTSLTGRGRPGLVALPRIGRGIAAAIVEMLRTGRWSQLDRLRGTLDPVRVFQTVSGIGPALAQRVHDTLGVDTLEALEIAAHDGRLDAVPGIGPRRAATVRGALQALLGSTPASRRPPGGPAVGTLLDVDREYREKATAGALRTIAPRRFNPEGTSWLPVLHTRRGRWHFTALYSNTARAHELGRTRDWVVVYFYDDDHREGQHTIVTETQGPLAGQLVVRGREAECHARHFRAPRPITVRPWRRRPSAALVARVALVVTRRPARTGPAAPESAAGPEREPSGHGGDRPREPSPGPKPSTAGAVSLWLDTYEDIFSDFDPHPYGQRALSEDFLAEARRAVRDRRDEVPELRFLVPMHIRNLEDEATIRKRLRDHFRRHADRLARERRRGIWVSLAIAAAGFAVMTASALLRRQPETIARTVLHVLLEPGGCVRGVVRPRISFFYGTRELAREHAFYRKMARADVVFIAYAQDAPSKASASERAQAP